MRAGHKHPSHSFFIISILITALSACQSEGYPTSNSVPTFIPSTSTPTQTPLPTLTPTPTPLECLSRPGKLKQDSLATTVPAQEFLIYLPPCYQEIDSISYPVLYLLHGQTYTDDQWVRIGAVDHADRLILSGEIPPFIIIFPDDRYWNLPPGPGFGDRLLDLVPYVDKNYRTLEDSEHRAIGGLSRGGGWAIRLGLTHPNLFGALGLHSPVVFNDDGGFIESWVSRIPVSSMPRLWLDIGDRDKELGSARLLDRILSDNDFPHEFYVYLGDHTEAYWSLHVEEYLRWYGAGWQPNP